MIGRLVGDHGAQVLARVLRDLDPDALACYLNLGYVPHPRTLYRHIRKLPPGHRLDFDASAARSGLDREAALAQMAGSPFLEDRRTDMVRTFDRLDRLRRDQALLVTATPVERIFMPQRLRDAALLSGTWADFRPALPLTAAGVVAATLGSLGGWLLVLGLARGLSRPFRRRPAPTVRIEPPLR